MNAREGECESRGEFAFVKVSVHDGEKFVSRVPFLSCVAGSW